MRTNTMKAGVIVALLDEMNFKKDRYYLAPRKVVIREIGVSRVLRTSGRGTSKDDGVLVEFFDTKEQVVVQARLLDDYEVALEAHKQRRLVAQQSDDTMAAKAALLRTACAAVGVDARCYFVKSGSFQIHLYPAALDQLLAVLRADALKTLAKSKKGGR